MPGNAGDAITSKRDAAIILTHAIEYKGEEAVAHDYIDAADFLRYAGLGLSGDYRSQPFVECIEKRQNGCVLIALKEKLVPTFEEYAAQIDAFLASGLKPHCTTKPVLKDLPPRQQ